jgi:hypothetical protein
MTLSEAFRPHLDGLLIADRLVYHLSKIII